MLSSELCSSSCVGDGDRGGRTGGLFGLTVCVAGGKFGGSTDRLTECCVLRVLLCTLPLASDAHCTVTAGLTER